MKAKDRGALNFIGVANLIVCVLFLIMSVPFFMGQFQVLRSWPVRQAQVIRSEVVTQPAGKHEQLYAAKLELVYAVKGQPVTAEVTSYESKNYEATAERAAEFPVGSRHAIRYDPGNPSQARIGAGWNRRFFAVPLITLGIGLAFGAIAAGFFIGAKMVSMPAATAAS
jgi:hypothetical protein